MGESARKMVELILRGFTMESSETAGNTIYMLARARAIVCQEGRVGK